MLQFFILYVCLAMLLQALIKLPSFGGNSTYHVILVMLYFVVATSSSCILVVRDADHLRLRLSRSVAGY